MKINSFKFKRTLWSRQPSAVEKQSTLKFEHFGLNLCSQLQLLGSCTLAYIYFYIFLRKMVLRRWWIACLTRKYMAGSKNGTFLDWYRYLYLLWSSEMYIEICNINSKGHSKTSKLKWILQHSLLSYYCKFSRGLQRFVLELILYVSLIKVTLKNPNLLLDHNGADV